MNKKNMMLVAGLMLSVATAMPSIGKQEREVVYTLKTLGRDLSQEAIIMQNIDMFIPLFEMSSQIKESKLQPISVKSTLAKSAAAIGGIIATRELVPSGIEAMRKMCFGRYLYETPQAIRYMQDCLGLFTSYICTIAATCTALNLYDTFKTNNELQKSLALDKEILAELVAIKESMVSQVSAAVDAQ